MLPRYNSMDQIRLTGEVFIDFGKAFNNVNHEAQLNKLRGRGLMDGELEWSTNYLKNRTQIVEFQSVSLLVSSSLLHREQWFEFGNWN